MKKRGGQLSECLWCGEYDCNHCRCTGFDLCSHAKDTMCSNQRYRNRRVCNPCGRIRDDHLFQTTSTRTTRTARTARTTQTTQTTQSTQSTQPTAHQIIPMYCIRYLCNKCFTYHIEIRYAMDYIHFNLIKKKLETECEIATYLRTIRY